MSYDKYVVSFIDVLGTRSRQDFESKFAVHRLFHESMQAVKERGKNKSGYFRKVFSFSDCAYIFHGARKSDISQDEEDALIQAALFNTSIATLPLLDKGYLLRGGISYGEAYMDESSFFGPSVEEAYEIESKTAITPRIVISKNLGARSKTFSDNAHAAAFSEENIPSNFLPKPDCMPELIIHRNDTFFLNLLYIIEMEGQIQFGNREINHSSIVRSIVESVTNQIPSHPWESKERTKLEWMREYAQASRTRYGTEYTSFAAVTDS